MNYYKKVKVKGKVKYKKIKTYEFPSQPAEGIWLVAEGGNSRECIVRLSDLPKEANLPSKLYLSRYKNEIIKCFQINKPCSMNDRANSIIDFISSLKGSK